MSDIDHEAIRRNLCALHEQFYEELDKIDTEIDGLGRMVSIAKTNIETAILYADRACFLAWSEGEG